MTAEQGMPLDQAHFEVGAAIYTLRAFSAMQPKTQVFKEEAGHKIVEHRTPLGVIAAITQWNFPLILLMNKVGPALLAGNTIVAKPAPTTPLTSLLFGEICQSMLPAGVINIVCDKNDLDAYLASHPDVAKVALTGSTATGKRVMARSAADLKRVTLELRGNDAAIVLDDVDPIQAARRVYEGAMANAGQNCVDIKRAYVLETIYGEFCVAIVRLAGEAVVDDGARQGTQIGPAQNLAQFELTKIPIEDARQHRNIIAGGEVVDRPAYSIPSKFVRDLLEGARLVEEEKFSLILPVLKCSNIDDVNARANDSEFGVGGADWDKDITRASAIAMRFDAGTIWVNKHLAIDPNIPLR